MAESNVEIKNVIICFILLSIIYLVGLALQIRIIIISIQDRDMMWKINTSHSIIMTIYYAVQIIIQTVTHIVPNLSKYSGSWFCTFLLFSNLYGMVSIVGHSLFTAAHKYVFVINATEMIKFGKEKAKQISLWIRILLPAVFALTYTFRPYVRGIVDVDRCYGGLQYYLHGISILQHVDILDEKTLGGMAERLFFCGLGTYHQGGSFDQFMHIANQTYCFIQFVITCIIVGKMMEFLLYRRLFSFMER